MTDADLYDEDPAWMLRQVAAITSPRKLRLFMCGLLRAADPGWNRLPHRAVIELAEQAADGGATMSALRKARSAIRGKDRPVDAGMRTGWTGIDFLTWCLANPDVRAGLTKFHGAAGWAFEDSQSLLQSDNSNHAYNNMIREVFANPFRPSAADPRWLTPTPVCLAHDLYQERAFKRLPILADALEEAGCTNVDILSHCRSEGPHVRGCWAVDLILGKK